MHFGVAVQLFIMYLANMFFMERLRSRLFIIVALLSVVIFSIFFEFIQVYVTGMFFLFLFLVSMSFTKKIFYTFYYTLISVMLYIYSDNIVMGAASFFQKDFPNIYRFIYGTFVYIVLLFVAKYLTIKVLNFLGNESSFFKVSCFIMIVTFLFFYLSIIFERSVDFGQLPIKTINNIYVLFYGGITIFTCVLIGYLFRKKSLFEKSQREIEFLEEYTKNLEERYEEIRGFKHDYQNILLSIESFIRTDDMSSLEKYFYEELRLPMFTTNEESRLVDSLSKINDRPIKSLIALKILLARNLNIQVNLAVQNNISILNVHQVVLVRVLGIILDNAIEEAKTISNSLIDIDIYRDKEKIIFTISNSTNLKRIDCSMLKQKGYTTKGGEDRGLGLSNIEKLIKSKPQKIFIETKVTKEIFTQIITINMR